MPQSASGRGSDVPGRAALLGGGRTAAVTRSQRVSNRRFRNATGWAPQYANASDGWAATVAAPAMGVEPCLIASPRIIVALLAISALVLGFWAAFDPRGFYANFPGGGRHWVSADGPYNEHLVRDFGSLNLGLAAVGAGRGTGGRSASC